MARRQAAYIRTVHQLPDALTERELYQVLSDCGVEIGRLPRQYPPELVIGHRLYLRCDLLSVERLWWGTHGLHHVIFHMGNQFRFSLSTVWQQEHQADLFAGWLLIGPTYERYCQYEDTQLTVWDMAEEASVPPQMAWRWLQMIQHDQQRGYRYAV